MQLGKVIGQVISARSEGNLAGTSILIVSYLDGELKSRNKSAACIDTVKAKTGDIVLLCSSSSARMTKATRYVAADNTIIGIVDSISGIMKKKTE